jgi:hypothetical protein
MPAAWLDCAFQKKAAAKKRSRSAADAKTLRRLAAE